MKIHLRFAIPALMIGILVLAGCSFSLTPPNIPRTGGTPGGGTPGWVNLTAAYGLPPAADDPAAFTVEGPNTQHVVYRGTNNHIYEVIW